ncbi:MAG: ABC transporter substrate-binding protein [Bryobacterales bacterium]|nr:ABC transporter substrate-binding protein [Bryobacterales bacterium]
MPVLLLLLTAGCGQQQQAIRLGIAAQQSLTQMPVYLAQQLGYYEAQGVRVELAEFPGASKGLEAFVGGSIDVLSGYYPQVLQLNRQGRPAEAFLPVFDSLFVALAVSPKSSRPIEGYAALRGAKIGVPALGAAAHQLLDYLLRKHGIDPAEVTPIAIGTASRAAAAMERGIVDAGIVSDFTIRYLEKRFGPVRLLADTRTRQGMLAVHGVDSFPGTVLMATPAWLSEHRLEADKLRAAVRRAMDWMRSHTAEEVAARMPPAHYGEDQGAFIEAIRLGAPLLAQSDTVSEAGHRAAVEFLPPAVR